ncbi:carotenoid oxygenase family protein [Streptomyces sp. NPDC052109]|uniref:carotenoid oxygenase family protein n=1 Tax=Streptomyces sp. NPDC052109 TaxID=3155527 RepID=UPI0034387C4F
MNEASVSRRHRHGCTAAAAALTAAYLTPDGGTPPDGAFSNALAYVHNPDRGAADLVILAAQDFTGVPVSRVHLPGRVPPGFHGSRIPDA